MTNTKGLKSPRDVSGAFTVSRNFSLHPLHSKVQPLMLGRRQNIPCILSSTCDTTVSPAPSPPSTYGRAIDHSTTHSPPRSPTHRAQLEEHSCSLTSVNFITSASESRTEYIEVKLCNNLKRLESKLFKFKTDITQTKINKRNIFVSGGVVGDS